MLRSAFAILATVFLSAPAATRPPPCCSAKKPGWRHSKRRPASKAR
ncbi:MAG TPA: hypothetical protein VK389_08715 [Thermoanaerobaculia bacterium]|nr:hypothetical protein [Thermoanaerobaculia bacterium]